MWILFVIIAYPISDGPAVTAVEMHTRESCISAIETSKRRHLVKDAWCVKK